MAVEPDWRLMVMLIKTAKKTTLVAMSEETGIPYKSLITITTGRAKTKKVLWRTAEPLIQLALLHLPDSQLDQCGLRRDNTERGSQWL